MKIFLKFLAIFFILTGTILLALNLCLKTDTAKEKVEQIVEKVITDTLGLEVQIDNLVLSLPLIANVGNITFYDKNSEVLSIKDFRINILPSPFSLWEVIIWSVSAKEILFLNSRIIKPITPNNTNNSRSFFNPNIIIREVDVEKIILSPTLTNQKEKIIINLNSSLKFYSKKQQLNFSATSNLLSPGRNIPSSNSLEIFGLYNIRKDKLKINSLKIQSDIVEAGGHFQLDKSNDQITGELKYSTTILEPLLSINWKGIKSNMSGIVKITGPASKPIIQTFGKITIDFPENDYFQFLPLSWSSYLMMSRENISGTIKLIQGNVEARGEIKYNNKKLYLHNLKAVAPHFIKTANLLFDPNSSILTGVVSVNDTTLRETANSFPFLNSGAMQLSTTYSSPDNKKQHITVKGQIKNLVTKFGNCDLIDIDIHSSDLWNLKFSKLNINLLSLSVNNFALHNITLNAHSEKDLMHVGGSIIANKPYLIDLDFASILSLSPKQELNINIHNLSGKIGTTSIKNSNDILFESGEKTTLKVEDLKIGDGFMNTTAQLTQQEISAIIKLEKFPMCTLSSFLPDSFRNAAIKGSINLSGSFTKPLVKTDIGITNISLPNIKTRLDLNLVADLSDSQTNITSKFLEEEEDIALLSVKLPGKFTLSPFAYTINNQSAFKATFSTIESLDLLSLIPLPPDNNLKGSIKGNVVASGTLSNPDFSGIIELTNGEYSYKQYGIKLKNISSQITANGSKISFAKIIANDHSNNALEGSGTISLNNNRHFHFTIETDKFNLMGTPYLDGELRGCLTLDGNKDSATGKGSFALGPMEIKIPEYFQRNIPELHITEIITEDKKAFYQNHNPYELKLDIVLETAKQVYIRGWGVDSLLQGQLHVTGYPHAPLIHGTLKSVRGKYKEFGRSLNVKKGVLIFDGPIPPSPYLNIVSVAIEGSNEIRLILSGSIQKPDIIIDSTPAMRKEEAMSMLLFGKNPENISTFQAIQLADSVRRLSGYGGGFDPLVLGRKILGMDDIHFKSDSKNPENTSVGLGKYLTDKVYFEVENSWQEGSAKTRIEVQITPKISIENITEQKGNTHFGINWRFDY